jgi:hypothetical protein
MEVWLALVFCIGNGSPCAAMPIGPAFDGLPREAF